MDKASELALDFVWRLMNDKPIQEVDVRAPNIEGNDVFHLYCNCKSEFPNFKTLSGPDVPDTISSLEDLPPEVSLHRTEIFREQKMMHVWMGVCSECDVMYYGRTEPRPVQVQREFSVDKAVDEDVVILRNKTTGDRMNIPGIEWNNMRAKNQDPVQIWDHFSNTKTSGPIEVLQSGGPLTSTQTYLADGFKNYNPTSEQLEEARVLLKKAYQEQREELAKQTLYKQPKILDDAIVYYDGKGEHDGKRMVHTMNGEHSVVNSNGSTTPVPEVTTCPACRNWKPST